MAAMGGKLPRRTLTTTVLVMIELLAERPYCEGRLLEWRGIHAGADMLTESARGNRSEAA